MLPALAMFKPVLLDLLREARLAEQTFVHDLDPAERDAAGTPERWSARDHVSHIAYWRDRLATRLEAVADGRPQPDMEHYERANPVVFEERRHRSWPDVLADAERAFAAHVACIERLTDEDLTAFDRYDWLPDGEPLHAGVMGSSYEHAQQHLAQFHLDRGDPATAAAIHETWVARVVEADTPPAMRAAALYNLACFHATQGRPEAAAPLLERALALHPRPWLRELSLTDPDLESLRH
jgi:tetratricopeptide (TPR) repeat protein